MTEPEREIAKQLARIMQEVRIMQRNGVLTSPKVLTAMNHGVMWLQVAVNSLAVTE